MILKKKKEEQQQFDITALLMNRLFKSSASISIKNPNFLIIQRSIHSKPDLNSNNDLIIKEICNSLQTNFNWEILNRKFKTLNLNDSIIHKVLIELKQQQQPSNAKKTLSFFHWSAQFKNSNHDITNYCTTIHILLRARMLIDALALLESIVKKQSLGGIAKLAIVESLMNTYNDFTVSNNPIVFDLLVQVYAKMRMFDIAIEVCSYLDKMGVCLRVNSYNLLIQYVEKSPQNELIWKVYELMIETRTYPNGETIKIMINGLCKEGKLQSVIDVLDRICGKKCSPMVIVNSSFIFGIIKQGRVDEGILILKQMLMKNMTIDTVAFSLIVYGEIKNGNLDSAMKLFEKMLNRGFKPNSFVYTSFIEGYCRAEKVDEAIRLIEEIEAIDLKLYDDTFNHLISGCTRSGRVEESLRFCEKMMERKLVPSLSAFNEMVGNLGVARDLKRANAMLTLMLDNKFLPNETTFSNLINGFCKSGEVEEAIKLYHEMEFRSLSPGLLCFSSLIQSLCQCGKLGEAEKYLKVMKDRSIVPSECIYKALIAAYSKKDDKSRILQLVKETIDNGWVGGLEPSLSMLDNE